METNNEKKENPLVTWFKSSSGLLWLFAIVLVMLNLVSVRAFKRWDITGPRSYSLSGASREAVNMLDSPLSVKVFFSKNLTAPYSSVYQYVQDILSEYKSAANKNFSYEYFDMDKKENQNLARNYGISQVQIREVKNNEVGFKNAYMGLVLTYADQIEILDGITSSDGLEYRITTSISKVVSAADALSGITDPVTVTLYKSEKLKGVNIQGFDMIDSSVQKAFDAVNKKFGGQLVLQTENPSSAEAEALGNQYGIQVLSLRNGDGSKENTALGLVVECGKKFKVVPLESQNMIFTFVVVGLDELEDNLLATVQSLVSKTSTVAYITGHGELDISDSKEGAGNFASILEGSYTFESVNLSEKNIPAGVQTVMINGPKEKFSDVELYKLDQFLMRGGNLMVFADPFNVITPQGQQMYYQQPQYIPTDTGLEGLLEKYGAKLEKSYVFDENCFAQNNEQFGKLTYYFAPMLQKESLAKKSVITQNLSYVIFLQPGPIDVSAALANKEVGVNVLAKTSAKSWTQDSNFMLDPRFLEAPADKSKEKSENIVVLLEGKFSSAYENAVKTESEESEKTEKSDDSLSGDNHIRHSVQNGKIFLASTSFITTSALLQPDSNEPIAMFLMNAMDYMNGNPDLCTMRTKGLSLNPLKKNTGASVNFIKYFNEIGLAVLLAIAGLIVYLCRRQHRAAIRMRYNPNDAREISTKKDKSNE